jgi:hypothetical protein
VNVLDVGLHPPAPGRDVVGVILFQCPERLDALLQAALNGVSQEILKRAYGTRVQGPVRSWDGRPEIPSSGLKTGIGGTLSGAVNANQGLKQSAVG